MFSEINVLVYSFSLSFIVFFYNTLKNVHNFRSGLAQFEHTDRSVFRHLNQDRV